jgi:hypothetical protein
MARSRSRRRKTKVRFYLINGLKCQGRKEVRYVKECVRYSWPTPTKAERVETPYGFYTPDFEHPENYVEIKCLGTFEVCRGLKSYKGIGVPSDLQWRKIKHVAKHVKPITIIVYLSKRETVPTYIIEETNITIIYKGGYKKKK